MDFSASKKEDGLSNHGRATFHEGVQNEESDYSDYSSESDNFTEQLRRKRSAPGTKKPLRRRSCSSSHSRLAQLAKHIASSSLPLPLASSPSSKQSSLSEPQRITTFTPGVVSSCASPFAESQHFSLSKESQK